MSLIYEPRGRAREYSPLALNIYNGCDHGCSYCYGTSTCFMSNTEAIPKKDLLAKLDKELDKHAPTEQVLLSFIGDPYCRRERTEKLTRSVLMLLKAYRVPVAILTKGGARCLRDIDLFVDYGAPIMVGATLTFADTEHSLLWEPNADIPENRADTLAELHEAGVTTWVSLEPVIIPTHTLSLIDATHEFVDVYKVGKWNHDARAGKIDWEAFGNAAVETLRGYGARFYAKEDLRKHITVPLTEQECDMNALTVHNIQQNSGLKKMLRVRNG